MDWTPWFVAGATGVAFVAFKRLGLVGVETAVRHRKAGGIVIDVRSEREFQGEHIPEAINIPLGELKQRIGNVAPAKDRPVLLHCLSGGRSGIGCRGPVYNLGSYARAAKIVRQARQ